MNFINYIKTDLKKISKNTPAPCEKLYFYDFWHVENECFSQKCIHCFE